MGGGCYWVHVCLGAKDDSQEGEEVVSASRYPGESLSLEEME